MHGNPHVATHLSSIAKAIRHTVYKLAEYGIGLEEALELIGRATDEVLGTSRPQPEPEAEFSEPKEPELATFTVRPDEDDLWLLEAPGVHNLYERKEDAIAAAIEARKENENSMLHIAHGADDIETYGPGEAVGISTG